MIYLTERTLNQSVEEAGMINKKGQPGKTRSEQAVETRQCLLDTAKKLFATNGYTLTSVRSINRELSMSDGILYHYFPGGKRKFSL